MVRTLEGKEAHHTLMEKAAKFLTEQGYEVVFQAKLGNGRIDVLGFKDKEKVGIECQVMPSWTAIAEKIKKYKPYLTRFIVFLPSFVNPRVQSLPDGVEIMKIDIPEYIKTTTIKLADSLWREVKVYAAKKGLKLTQVVEAALRKYLEETEKEE